jgi:hypothetical protein
LTVINLGKGKNGVLVAISGEDSSALKLLVYRAGLAERQMRILQSIEAAE